VIAYVDTSAAVKFLVEEAETSALVAWESFDENVMVSSDLLVTELGRVRRRSPAITKAAVAAVLAMIQIQPLARSDFRAAGDLEGSTLRSLDALHLQAALRLEADAMLTYDDRLLEACAAEGLATISPAAVQAAPAPSEA
jgi:predicted nucleic acid-binding protein